MSSRCCRAPGPSMGPPEKYLAFPTLGRVGTDIPKCGVRARAWDPRQPCVAGRSKPTQIAEVRVRRHDGARATRHAKPRVAARSMPDGSERPRS
eukprot:3438352-Pyramimonas_sp.AAC.1